MAARTPWHAGGRRKFGDGSGPIAGLSGKCLDDAGSSTADGNPVQLYSCNNTLAQQWKLTGDTLQVLGKCAAVNGTVNGTKILLATCDGSAAQKFTVRSADKSLYNEDLRNAGKYYDGSEKGSGSQYLWQDDRVSFPRRASGTAPTATTPPPGRPPTSSR
ncbi:RICIN domain-containing protein [Actinacidiphila soli]|uniref:RICIN domain-containing protein n=1 Tax=Actinacidiphila soli TaxID=2487275 RepID=UPI0013E3C4A5|nr:RICIN domain-containing protein [Actinacidiphila soli]